ncbi:XdhC family protein [Amycolatopsis sp. M39]|uniref:XdhC family protein n=1 Tax=Amycolatopsis sp. M39 TaxID=1825094 RepID=UPI0007E14651|nr:putative xanthine dehydrogenase subunit A [Amycolatopsis sp. M39]
MQEVVPELVEDWRAGRAAGLATVVRTMKSAPRPVGASLLRRADGAAVGSVSGGCVEGAVYELAAEVVETGVPVLRRYGVSDDEAFEAGLTCGGILDVFVEPVDRTRYPELEGVADDIAAGRAVGTVTVIRHPDPRQVGRRLVVRHGSAEGSLGAAEVDRLVAADARGLLAAGLNTTLEYGPGWERQGEGIEVYVASYAPAPRMLVFGAIDFAAATARQGKLLGFHVTVCDARPVFATRARFPDADELVVEWPSRYLAREIDEGRVDDRTVVCVLTHDPKFDVPVLMEAFRMPAGCFLGAMGSRRTHEDRLRRLREAGAAETDFARLHSPPRPLSRSPPRSSRLSATAPP